MPSDTLLGVTPGTYLNSYNPNFINAFTNADFLMSVDGCTADVNQAYPYAADSMQWDSAVDAAPNDQFSQVTYTTVTVGSIMGVAARLNTDGEGYYYFYAPGSGIIQIGIILNHIGFGRSLSAYANTGVSVSAGDILRLEVSGSSPVHLSCKVNNSEVLTYDDSSLNKSLSGQYGLMAYGLGSPLAVSNWSAGGLASSHTIPASSGGYSISGAPVTLRIGSTTYLRYRK